MFGYREDLATTESLSTKDSSSSELPTVFSCNLDTSIELGLLFAFLALHHLKFWLHFASKIQFMRANRYYVGFLFLDRNFLFPIAELHP